MRKFNRLLSAIAIPVIGLAAATAYGENDAGAHTNGELVLKRCTAAIAYFDRKEKADMYDVGWCLGFVKGIGNGYLYGVSGADKSKAQYCPPKDLTVGQEVRAITDFIKANAQQQNRSGSALALVALIKAYPCNPAGQPNLPQIDQDGQVPTDPQGVPPGAATPPGDTSPPPAMGPVPSEPQNPPGQEPPAGNNPSDIQPGTQPGMPNDSQPQPQSQPGVMRQQAPTSQPRAMAPRNPPPMAQPSMAPTSMAPRAAPAAPSVPAVAPAAPANSAIAAPSANAHVSSNAQG